MSTQTDLVQLERAGWKALATSGEAATDHYDRVLASQVLMLLPGGLVIDDRSTVVESMGGAPWDSYELEDETVVPLTDDSAVVAYKARVRRGEMDYQALFNSTYVRVDGQWRLAIHQQTPV